ncbi:hypothetical protein Tco_0791752, partial [Tanacetum coccineum]
MERCINTLMRPAMDGLTCGLTRKAFPNKPIKVPSNESQRNTTDPSVVVSNSLAIDYDLEDESLVCSTPLPPLEKLVGAKPVSRPKTIKSILKSNSTFKAKTLKGIALKEPSSALAKDNKKGTSTLKTFSAPTGKLKNVKIEDGPPLATVMKELNELKLQLSKNKSSYSRNHQSQQVPHNSLQNRYNIQFKISCKLFGQNNHLSENCFHVLFCKKCKRTDHRTCDHAEFMSSIKTTQHLTGQGESSSRSRPSRPEIPFPSINMMTVIISLRRGIKARNPQHVTKNCKTYGSNVHTTNDHNDIEWFRKGESLKAKKSWSKLLAQIWEVPGPEVMYEDDSTSTTEGHGYVKL